MWLKHACCASATWSKKCLALQVEGEDIKASAAYISNPEVAILYSCGVQALHMKQYNFAHECFQARHPHKVDVQDP